MAVNSYTHMNSLVLSCLLFMLLLSLQSCKQETKMKTYKGDKFSLEYPANWQMTNEKDILSFFPAENYGALTVSNYAGIDFPEEETKKFILEMYGINDDPAKVKMMQKGGVTEFIYEHTEEGRNWVTKVIRNSTNFYLLTINCDFNKWDAGKSTFIKAMDSFRFN